MFYSMLLLTLSLVNVAQAADNYTIEHYREDRDCAAVTKIINDHPELKWETAGFPEGTTQKYLKDPWYVTKVLRVNDTTIGFVNYKKVRDYFLLTFFIKRWSILHSIGIAQEYQGKGYGKILLRHVIEDMKKHNAQRLVTVTYTGNKAAEALFEGMGFELGDVSAQELGYYMDFKVSADKLPHGDFIQRHPKISLAIAALACIAVKRPAVSLSFNLTPHSNNQTPRANQLPDGAII